MDPNPESTPENLTVANPTIAPDGKVSKKAVIVVITLVLFIVLMIGVFVVYQSSQVVNPDNQDNDTGRVVELNNTCKNEELGIEIGYPDEWTCENFEGGIMRLQNDEYDVTLGKSGLDYGCNMDENCEEVEFYNSNGLVLKIFESSNGYSNIGGQLEDSEGGIIISKLSEGQMSESDKELFKAMLDSIKSSTSNKMSSDDRSIALSEICENEGLNIEIKYPSDWECTYSYTHGYHNMTIRDDIFEIVIGDSPIDSACGGNPDCVNETFYVRDNIEVTSTKSPSTGIVSEMVGGDDNGFSIWVNILEDDKVLTPDEEYLLKAMFDTIKMNTSVENPTASLFENWNTYTLKGQGTLKASIIKYPTGWTASQDNGGDDFGEFYNEIIKNTSSENYYININRNNAPNTGDKECLDINESNGKLTWTVKSAGGDIQTKTVNFEKVQTQDEKLYIFEGFDRPNHILMTACNSSGYSLTNYGRIDITLPKNYTPQQLNEVLKIISSLELSE